MKVNVPLIRETISKIVGMLTKKSIKVTQRGTQAFVEYHKVTQAIIRVNLPYIPDDASLEFVAAIQGFLDHEVGHVLKTDPKVVKQAHDAGPRVANLANLLEDVLVERLMIEQFPGCGKNLDTLRAYYFRHVTTAAVEKALMEGDMNRAIGCVAMIQFRAWGGQKVAVDFLIDKPGYAELVKPLAQKIGEDLIARIVLVKTSMESLELAKLIKKRLDEPPTPAPPPSLPSDPPSDDRDSREEASEEPGEGAAASHGPDELEERASTEEADASTSAAPDEEETKEITEPTEPAAANAAEGEGGPSGKVEDQIDGEDQTDKTDDIDDIETESSDSDPAGDAQPEGEPEEAGDIPAGHAADCEASETHPEDRTTEAVDGVTTDTADLGEIIDEFTDFDAEISEALSKAAHHEISAAPYKVFSTDWDRVEEAPDSCGTTAVEDMVSSTAHMIGTLQKSLERAMAAKARKCWDPGQRKGRVAPGALFKVATGDERIFRKRYETRAKNTAVSLLIDCSGSMNGKNKIATAGKAAFALSSTLERLKITHEVIGFTTRALPDMRTEVEKHSSLHSGSYARLEALYMPLFKGFQEPLSTMAKSRLAELLVRPAYLRENVDGECVQIAARRLAAQKAERRVLIVLSDGQPACPGDRDQLQRHLKKVVKDVEAQGIEVIGIGIDSDSVKDYYAKRVVLRSIEDLPTTVIKQLQEVLLSA